MATLLLYGFLLLLLVWISLLWYCFFVMNALSAFPLLCDDDDDDEVLVLWSRNDETKVRRRRGL